MTTKTDMPYATCPVNLSQWDNSEFQKGRSVFIRALWHFLGTPLLRSNMLPLPRLKCSVLRLFGARIGRDVYMKPGVRVKFPWYLQVGDYCWIGEDVWIDNLAPVVISSHVCISQGAYLCTGNHDWKTTNMKLFRRSITLRDGCWIGARATICPGVNVAEGAIVAVGSVIAKDIPPYQVWAGNPAHYVRDRVFYDSKTSIIDDYSTKSEGKVKKDSAPLAHSSGHQ